MSTKRDAVDEKFDLIRRSLERALVDLKLAKGGDRSYGRLTLLGDTLHEASMAMYAVIDDIDLYGMKAARARKQASMGLPAPQVIERPPHVTPVARRRALPGPGESIFD